MRKVLPRPTPGGLTATVSRTIREQIGTGLIGPGQCVPSERELGRLLGVSRVTVRRGLDQLVQEGLLRREPGRGYFLPDPLTPNGQRRTRTAIVFVHSLPEQELVEGHYHAAMWAGARQEAARAGFLTLISALGPGRPASGWAEELAKVAAGVLSDSSDPETIRVLLQAGVPVVQVDYYRLDLPVDAVVQDDSGGIVTAVEHLHQRGHRRIGYLDTAGSLRATGFGRNAEGRLSGYLQACGRLGLSERMIASADWLSKDAVAGTVELLDAGVTAIVVPHSEIWPSVREVLGQRGITIPGDFGVVVWGDPPRAADPGEFPTAVTWSKEQMGCEGARRLIDRLERADIEPATIVIPARLVDRGTGGRGPAGE